MMNVPRIAHPNRPDETDVRSFVRAYLLCAVWSSTGDDTDSSLMDLGFHPDDLTLEAQAYAEEDCREFLSANVVALIVRAIEDPPKGATPYSYEQAGHDFWLTRNHHGAGFWDRGLGEVGDKLTEEAQAHGSADLILVADEIDYSA